MMRTNSIRYYRGRRVTWNPVNRLWWFKITDNFGDRVERCRNTFRGACEEIDQVGSLHTCPKCGVRTDCLYPMRQREGKWEEIYDGSEVGDHTEMFCYKCCGELEEGK